MADEIVNNRRNRRADRTRSLVALGKPENRFQLMMALCVAVLLVLMFGVIVALQTYVVKGVSLDHLFGLKTTKLLPRFPVAINPNKPNNISESLIDDRHNIVTDALST